MNRMKNYQLLISKLDAFIRKYYLNKIIKGTIYSIGVLLGLFLAFSICEYYLYLSPVLRKSLLLVYFLSFLSVTTIWVFNPLFKFFQLGSIISHNEAAIIIGKYFSNVQDKLINILELNAQLENGNDASALILASIDQKSEEIKLTPFRNAINLKDNKRYLRFALPPIFLFLILLFSAPSILTDSTYRFINNNTEFEKPAPFKFNIQNDALEVNQFDNFNLKVKVEGKAIPNEAYILIGDYRYKLRKEGNHLYSYVFRNVSDPISFKFNSGSVFSKDYTISIVSKPMILGFEISLIYPKHTNLNKEKLQNIGDLTIPEGTQVNWLFQAQHANSVSLRFNSSLPEMTKRVSETDFSLSKIVTESNSYKVLVENGWGSQSDSINYVIKVVQDEYPSISANSYQDEMDPNFYYFAGDLKDDYGLKKLVFHYSIKRENLTIDSSFAIKEYHSGILKEAFQFDFDFTSLDLGPGDEVIYYFEIIDNDALNGFKSSFSERKIKNMPTKEAIKEKEQENEEEIKKGLKNAIEKNKEIKKEVEKFKNNLLQKKELEWQDRKELEQIINKQKTLEKIIENTRERFDENLKNQQILDNTDEETLDQQESLEEQLEKLQNEELNEILQKIEELLNQLDKEQLLEMLENVNKNEKVLETNLERLMELFQQLELEKEMKETIEELEGLSEELEESAQDLEEESNPSKNNEESKEKMENYEKQLENIKENLNEIQNKNKQSKSSKMMNLPEENIKRAGKQLNESKKQLNEGNNKKAAEEQKKAANELKDAAEQMTQQMQDSKMQQMQEDMGALRQLMENLIGISFEQEALMEDINATPINTPLYVSQVQNQFKLKDDFALAKDSLNELAKRVFQLEAFLTEKVVAVEENLELSISHLEERKVPLAGNFQQRVMTYTNDLALMLSEVMHQMQQQMSQMMSGNQMCSQPQGQQNSGMPQDKISEGQKSLNQEMRDAGKQAGGTSAKEFAEMAAKQAALRKALEEKIKELQGQGKGNPLLQELAEEMDKIETDLVNKKLTNEMIERQEKILTKLLDHEKAEREQEWENERKSETAGQVDRVIPPSLEEYLKKRKAEIEDFRKVAPGLEPFYKKLLENYLDGIGTKFE